MKAYCEYTKEELSGLRKSLLSEYEKYKAMGLSLNMARGKPCPEQLDLTMGMFDILNSGSSLIAEDGTDCRNYGCFDGIPEAKKLLADMVGAKAEDVIVYGNSSLNIMYDTVSRAYTHGVFGNTPWCRLDNVKFLCPAPGYDRHFAVTESFGFELIAVEMKPDGPDMDAVEELVKDESVKGIWCVPKYSNPQGYTYSEQTVKRLASLKPAAPDFRIFWDNAYCIHDLYEDGGDSLPEILSVCAEAGNPDIVYEFVSTSKISFAGGGIAGLVSSKANLDETRKYLKLQTIGHDKINQLRHVRYFKDIDGMREHMKEQASVIRPKFKLVDEILHRELDGLGIGTWTEPRGGYFISFDAPEGCAKATVRLCREAGVVMTGAGASYPYGLDPRDSNIRIAPSYPSKEELRTAAKLFTLCVKLAAAEKMLGIV